MRVMSKRAVSKRAMAVVSSLLVMAVLMPVQAIAIQAYPVDGDVLAPYQAVIDELNETYGTEAAFVTYQESIDMGIPMPTPEHLGTVAEFRETLESFLVESLPISTAAQQASAAATLAASEPPIEAVCTSVVRDSNGMIIERWFEPVDPAQGLLQASASQGPLRTAASGLYTYAISGGVGGIQGTINNSNGYWRWTALTSYFWGLASSYPKFDATSATSTAIDNHRTYAVTWSGKHYATGASVGVTQTRYQEFNAGSAAAAWGV